MITKDSIAPCGMNCALCSAFQRPSKPCDGCRGNDENKSRSCSRCAIRLCENKEKFCYECDDFPCKRLTDLDDRYQTRYGMSMLDNLHFIKTLGLREFVIKEENKWACKKCHQLICIHDHTCPQCKTPFLMKG